MTPHPGKPLIALIENELDVIRMHIALFTLLPGHRTNRDCRALAMMSLIIHLLSTKLLLVRKQRLNIVLQFDAPALDIPHALGQVKSCTMNSLLAAHVRRLNPTVETEQFPLVHENEFFRIGPKLCPYDIIDIKRNRVHTRLSTPIILSTNDNDYVMLLRALPTENFTLASLP